MNESFVNIMARSNPNWIAHTWMDVTESLARLQEKRTFARAYRSLPNGLYERMTGGGLDRNIWMSKTEKDGAVYAYAANLHWWQPTVTLRFSDGAQVRDLIQDKPVALDDGAWTFTLAPYSIQTFRLTGGEAIEARASIPPDAGAYVGRLVVETLEKAKDVAAQARQREAELSGKNGWEAIEELETRIAKLEESVRAADLAEAYTLTLGALPIAQQTIERLLRGETIQRIWQ